jgi:hypothetical protein
LSGPKLLRLFPCRILSVDCEVDPENKTGSIRLEVETFLDAKKGGKKVWSLIIPNECLASEQLLVNAFCRQLFPPEYHQQHKYLVSFMCSFIQLIDDQKERQESEAFGWVFDREKGERCGFAYAGKLFKDDGTVLPSSNTDPVLSTHYMPQGKEQNWHDLMQIISEEKCPARECIAAIAFAAPIFWVRGTHNMTFWAFSRDSAAYKSTSLNAALAVWGSPTRTKENRRVSIAALEGKLGRIRSLPVGVDELIDTDQVETLAKNINTLSEGSSGSKSRRNGQLREKLDWQTIILACSNKSIREHYTAKHASTDAGFMRVFEIQVPGGIPTRHDGDVHRLMSTLDYNFGHVGEKYAAYIAKNWRIIEKHGIAIDEQFCKEVNAGKAHRFWVACCTSIILGATLANVVTGKSYFNVPEIYQFLLKWFKEQATYVEDNVTIAGSTANTEDLVGQFLKHCHENQLWCTTMLAGQRGRGQHTTTLGTFQIGSHNPVIHIRYNRDERTVYISKSALLKFLAIDKHDAGAILASLKNNFGATAERVTLTHGLIQSITQPREACIRLNITPAHFLEEAMLAYNDLSPVPGPQLVKVSTLPVEAAKATKTE